jgi:hypothetical protein
MTKVAIIQESPVLLDRDRTIERAIQLIEDAALAKRDLDITGHYSRPDIFMLTVDTNPQIPVKFK